MSAAHSSTAEPGVPERGRTLRFHAGGRDFALVASSGVFSAGRLDPGTAVLLRKAPLPGPRGGVYLDLGCGYGPISMGLASTSEKAQVYAVDVNARALELVRTNAAALGLAERGIPPGPDEGPSDVVFDEIWSNPPIRVCEGAKIALVGPNGAGKTTLLRMVAGDIPVQEGVVARSGGLGVMRQFIGMIADDSTLTDLALSLAPPRVRAAGERLAAAERAPHAAPGDERNQLRYADALTAWGEAGGYDAEVLFDTVAVAALDLHWDKVHHRPVTTLSGGQQKRFALELLLRGADEVLLLDEPDNFLDVPAKRWLEGRLKESDKSVLYVSHDRELLAQTADRVVAVEGGSAWVHPGGFASWHEARMGRHEKLEEHRRRWDEEHEKLRQLMLMYKQKAAYNSGMASRYQAAVTRLRKFEETGPPPLPPKDQDIRMRLEGGRTGKRAIMLEGQGLGGPTHPVRLAVRHGDPGAV